MKPPQSYDEISRLAHQMAKDFDIEDKEDIRLAIGKVIDFWDKLMGDSEDAMYASEGTTLRIIKDSFLKRDR